jgi:hypothetical protein
VELEVNVGAEHRGAVLRLDGRIHRTTGNVLKLLIAERFRFVNFLAHTVRELNASLRV